MITSSSTCSSNRMIATAIAVLYVMSGSHTTSGKANPACNNNGSFSSACPADAKLLSINRAAQEAVVDAHNTVRQQWASGRGNVSVAACRMATIRWNTELAKLAEQNVKQCKLEHDDCHNTPEYKYSGQNLYIVGYSGKKAQDLITIIRNAIRDWAREGSDSNREYLSSYPVNHQGPTIGHFTLVAHERNVAVGCAVSNYLKAGYNTFLVACNYATTNFIGYPVYKICSKAASECNSGINSEYPALCSTNEKVDFNYTNE